MLNVIRRAGAFKVIHSHALTTEEKGSQIKPSITPRQTKKAAPLFGLPQLWGSRSARWRC